MHQLYLVGTPIGNLEDMSFRAIRTLKEVTLIAAEDTRKTGFLLAHYQIETPMTNFHDHTHQAQLNKIIEALQSGDVALVSDAGMPGLSDPGYLLVQAAVAAGHLVTPIPGPTAAISALVVSNLPTDQFYFLGFLPRKRKGRQEQLQQVASLTATLVLYESPHRILALLEDIITVLGNRTISIGRELTKMHEEIWRGSAEDGLAYFSANKIRGEFTVVVAGMAAETAVWSEEKVEKKLTALLTQGESPRAAAMSLVDSSGWRKRQLYQLALTLQNQSA